MILLEEAPAKNILGQYAKTDHLKQLVNVAKVVDMMDRIWVGRPCLIIFQPNGISKFLLAGDKIFETLIQNNLNSLLAAEERAE